MKLKTGKATKLLKSWNEMIRNAILWFRVNAIKFVFIKLDQTLFYKSLNYRTFKCKIFNNDI